MVTLLWRKEDSLYVEFFSFNVDHRYLSYFKFKCFVERCEKLRLTKP